VTITAATITGAGFSTVGGSFPLTLNAGQTATLQIEFDPIAAGAATGQLAVSSNSTSGGTTLVALSGTGTSTAHYVDLSWNAPASSTDPVAGYNIYRSISGGFMQMINASPVTQTVYVDNAVVSGSTYNYYTKSVDASGVESTASNQIAVTIP
jgi:fibronectin type 3 domain-containing protein